MDLQHEARAIVSFMEMHCPVCKTPGNLIVDVQDPEQPEVLPSFECPNEDCPIHTEDQAWTLIWAE